VELGATRKTRSVSAPAQHKGSPRGIPLPLSPMTGTTGRQSAKGSRSKTFLSPLAPEEVQKQIRELKSANQKPKPKSMFSKLSLRTTKATQNINRALRREVLAYTTDGIAQSVDHAHKLAKRTQDSGIMGKQSTVPSNDYYPEEIDEANGFRVQRFGMRIKYNLKLLYPKSQSTKQLLAMMASEEKEENGDGNGDDIRTNLSAAMDNAAKNSVRNVDSSGGGGGEGDES
jgi:hypothetical protein